MAIQLAELIDDAREEPQIVFAIEPLSVCQPDIVEVMERHAQELSFYKDLKGPIDPDWNWYAEMERTGALKFLVARDCGLLVGYFFLGISKNQHYQSLKVGFNDTFWLNPYYRREGRGLISVGYLLLKRAVEWMAENGADIAYLMVKHNHQYPAIMKRLGFVPEDVRYTKWLRGTR